MKKTIKIFFLFLGVLIVALGSGCNTNKYLSPGEGFLTKNEVIFDLEKGQKLKDKRSLYYELTTLYKQRPNENFFGLPGVSKRWFWYNNTGEGDTTKFKKFIKRQIAEVPAVFSDEKSYETAKTMEFYLQNRGYFEAEVHHVKDRISKDGTKISVTYYVNPKKRYTVETVNYMSKDSSILEILEEIKETSLLKKDSPVDGKLYEQEVARISKYLRNNGYAYFYPNYVAPLSGDSTNQRVKIDLEVLTPNNEDKHKTFRVGEIYLYPQHSPAKEVEIYKDTIIEGVHFMLPDGEDFRVKPHILLNNLYLTSGDLYNQSNFDKTNRSFGSLGIYKFVSLEPTVDLIEEDVLNFKILLTTAKGYELSSDFEINTSNGNLALSDQKSRFIGAGAGLSLKNRNIFRGAEISIINTDLNFDFNLKRDSLNDLVNTLDYKLNWDLYIPKFVDYFGVWKGLNKLHIVSDNFYKLLRENSNTHIYAGYNHINRFKFYKLNSFNSSFGYEIPPNKTQHYSLNHFGINYVKPINDIGIEPILADNPFLNESWKQQLFTGLILRNLGYTYTRPVSRLGESVGLGVNFEMSGLEVFAANKIYNSFAETPKTFELIRNKNSVADTTDFSQFITLDFNGTVFRQLTQKHQLALRLYAGIGLPFGFSDDVPYVKQFYVGGPNSLRAWTAREVGPGGYIDPQTLDPNADALKFFQTGNVKLEFNIEYRAKLFTILGFNWEAAAFVDIGNIWTTKSDPDRPFSKLSWRPEYDEQNEKNQDNFINQLAVGTGVGLRVDFSYFIFRLDVGIPIRNPYITSITENGQTTTYNWRRINNYGFRDLNFNIGLGYPF